MEKLVRNDETILLNSPLSKLEPPGNDMTDEVAVTLTFSCTGIFCVTPVDANPKEQPYYDCALSF